MSDYLTRILERQRQIPYLLQPDSSPVIPDVMDDPFDDENTKDLVPKTSTPQRQTNTPIAPQLPEQYIEIEVPPPTVVAPVIEETTEVHEQTVLDVSVEEAPIIPMEVSNDEEDNPLHVLEQIEREVLREFIEYREETIVPPPDIIHEESDPEVIETEVTQIQIQRDVQMIEADVPSIVDAPSVPDVVMLDSETVEFPAPAPSIEPQASQIHIGEIRVTVRNPKQDISPEARSQSRQKARPAPRRIRRTNKRSFGLRQV